jgi:Fur family ferric uptake transcriptional regulator
MTTPPARPRAAIPVLLSERGVRLTGPRRLVVEALVRHPGPQTAAEVHRRLSDRRVNLVSVYRTLNLLVDLGIARVADTSHGTRRFELAESYTEHHHHLICRSCGGVEDLEGCLVSDGALRRLSRRVRRARKFRVVDHDLRLLGYCRKCDT